MNHPVGFSPERLADFPFGGTVDPGVLRFAQRPIAPRIARFGALYGSSAPMKKLYQMIEKVAPTEATVLVIGESGTGKELVAGTIHKMSKRSDAPFLAINCGAISANLIEAELFGHERGSFTGANRMHKGYFERAEGGTLFLDEITEMAADLQVKLLRVLETGTFCRVGGDQEMRVNVRVVAASNRLPETAVAEGRLREDLMYRLSVFPVHMPPLRERAEDVELLAQHFLAELNDVHETAKAFSPQGLAQLRSYSWPGNVRQLKNTVQRAFILGDDLVDFEGLLETSREAAKTRFDPNALQFSVGTPLSEVERQLIFATLEHFGGNKKKTAEVLGLSLKTLYNRLSEYQAAGIVVPQGGSQTGQL